MLIMRSSNFTLINDQQALEKLLNIIMKIFSCNNAQTEFSLDAFVSMLPQITTPETKYALASMNGFEKYFAEIELQNIFRKCISAVNWQPLRI